MTSGFLLGPGDGAQVTALGSTYVTKTDGSRSTAGPGAFLVVPRVPGKALLRHPDLEAVWTRTGRTGRAARPHTQPPATAAPLLHDGFPQRGSVPARHDPRR